MTLRSSVLATALCLALTAAASTAHAQLAPPNAAGVTISHVHVNASDVDAQVRFWTAVGGTIVQREKLTMVQFPGIYVILRKQDYSGGTVGSSINHFGFYVRDFEPTVAKWKAAGLKWDPVNNPTTGQGFLTGPDMLRIEIYENKNISTPLAMHHIHLNITEPQLAQAWYVKNFGATAGKRNQYDTANVPGTEITLGKVDMPQAPTKGRSLDHMGFEVRNLDAFVAKLKANSVQINEPIRSSTNAAGIRLTYVTDPWGTEIEITEGLATTPVATTR